MKKLSSIFILFLFIFVSLSSCGYKSYNHGKEITPEKASVIIDGKTTKSEIFLEFGDPSKTMNNDKVFFYSWLRGGRGHIFGLGSGSAESKSLVIVFDENDIVESHKITRGATAAGAAIGD